MYLPPAFVVPLGRLCTKHPSLECPELITFSRWLITKLAPLVAFAHASSFNKSLVCHGASYCAVAFVALKALP